MNEIENKLMDYFTSKYSCSRGEVQLRQITPSDINRLNWVWESHGYLAVDNGKCVIINGLISSRLFQIKIRQYKAYVNIAGIFTNGQSTISLILNDSARTYFEIAPMDENICAPYPFILCGMVAEMLGTTIVPQ